MNYFQELYRHGISFYHTGTTREINAHFRANGESHKLPICNKFSVLRRKSNGKTLFTVNVGNLFAFSEVSK